MTFLPVRNLNCIPPLIIVQIDIKGILFIPVRGQGPYAGQITGSYARLNQSNRIILGCIKGYFLAMHLSEGSGPDLQFLGPLIDSI
jgi:hypothetical protein